MSEVTAEAAAAEGEKGTPENSVEVKGVKFPKRFETSRPMKEHIERIRAMDMRDDDVILCAYPRSGMLVSLNTAICSL